MTKSRLPEATLANSEAAIRTIVDTARITGSSPFGAILKTIGA